MRRPVRVLAACSVAVAAMVVAGPAASAHPLGNFTVNVYSGLRVGPDRMLVDLVVDMAEVPTYQARRAIDSDGDGDISAGESAAYARDACAEAARGVDVKVGGRAVAVGSESADVVFPPGAAGLPTLRLTCALVAALGEGAGERDVVFRNGNYDDRVGWREIVATGDGADLLASSVPAASVSDRLQHYPTDLLQSPPDQRSATLRVRPGVGSVASPAQAVTAPAAGARGVDRGVDRLSRSFTNLVARQRLTVAFGFFSLCLAVLLGGVHALAPGHGKTVMAAYLIGERGSCRQAWLIGATMTATHTAGVLLLGVVLTASTSVASEAVYPWLGLLSGLLLAAIGASLLVRSMRRRPHDSDHDDADHHQVGHQHPHAHRHDGAVGWRGLVGMGLAGGLLPSPSALVVLLGAIALGRAWFGVALVVAYGVGMAATLLGIGMFLVRASAGLAARVAGGPGHGPIALLVRMLPAATASVVLCAGLFFAVQGATRI